MTTCSWCAGSRRDPLTGGACRGCANSGMDATWALVLGGFAFCLFLLYATT